MAWYLNRALTNFRSAVNARWPNRDKASDGTIGDEAHQARVSDHNPDTDGSVDAWDMDVDGVDVEACKRAFEAHESSGYWVHNDQISFRSEGWKPRSYAYAGPTRNRHTKHCHWNTRPSHEGSAAPWAFPDSPAPHPTPGTTLPTHTVGSRTLRRGMTGTDVAEVQRRVNAAGARLYVDGAFGPATESAVRWYQRTRRLDDDGIVGPRTWAALLSGFGSRLLRRGSRGDDVRELQRLLNAHGARLAVDGIFGPATDSAVRAFQSRHRLAVDGIVGPKTAAELVRL